MIKMLKFRLPDIKSKKYYDYMKKKYEGYDIHHILLHRTTDYLLIPLIRTEHTKRHLDREYAEKMFMDDFLLALTELFSYIKDVEN